MKDVTLVHLRESLSSFSPLLERALKTFAQPLSVDSARLRPAAVVQASVAVEQEPDVRLELHRLQRRLDPTAIIELVAQYEAGASLAQLAREHSIHKRTVHAHLVRAGVQPRPKQVLNDEQLAEVIQRYQAGATLKQLGPQFGVANASIRNYLIRAGVTMRPAARPRRQATSE